MHDKARLRMRLRAAVWMAAVAGLFAAAFLLYVSYDHRLHIEAIGLITTAVVAGGISGCWIGWSLVDPEAEQDWANAMALGIAAALLTYPLFALLYTAGPIIAASIDTHTLVSLSGFTAVFLLVLFGVASSSIWLALPLAGIAGILLGKHYRKQRPGITPATN